MSRGPSFWTYSLGTAALTVPWDFFFSFFKQGLIPSFGRKVEEGTTSTRRPHSHAVDLYCMVETCELSKLQLLWNGLHPLHSYFFYSMFLRKVSWHITLTSEGIIFQLLGMFSRHPAPQQPPLAHLAETFSLLVYHRPASSSLLWESTPSLG